MSLETMKLSEAEKRFLITAITLVEMHKDNVLSKDDIANNLIKKYEDLGIAEIRERKGSVEDG